MLHCKTAVVTIALVNFIWFISDANAKSYNLFDLGLFQASSINDAGRVAGSYGGNAAIWNKGSVTLLENSFGFRSTASSISNTGFAVGNSFAMSGGDPRATVWIDGEARELEWGSSSYALAVNNSGHVVGESGAGINEGQHAYYWDGNNTTDLGTLGGKQSAAAGINDEGKVVGFSTISGNESEEHAVLWDSGVAVDLGGLGGANSYAFDRLCCANRVTAKLPLSPDTLIPRPR